MDQYKAKGQFIQRHYDKALALVAWGVLVGTLVVLALRLVSDQAQQDQFETDINSMTPRHPNAEAASTVLYGQARKALAEPVMMAEGGTNAASHLLVAPERVWCVECRKAIDYDATECPLCDAVQPPDGDDDKWASNPDGIWDSWLLKYGLRIDDMGIGSKDPDGDGFTTKEEFYADEREGEAGEKTDPTDAKSHPERTQYLYVADLKGVTFPLILEGKGVVGADGARKLQYKDLEARQRNDKETHFTAVGEIIGKTGWMVESAEAKEVMVEKAGYKELRPEPRYFATIRNGEKTVVLEEGAPPLVLDFTATLMCSRGDTKSEYVAQSGEPFEFDGKVYNVIRIDKVSRNVVLQRESDKKEFPLSSR